MANFEKSVLGGVGPRPITSSITERIIEITARAEKTLTVVEENLLRLMGPVPLECGTGDYPQGAPDGALPFVNAQLDDLSALVARLESAAGRLAAL